MGRGGKEGKENSCEYALFLNCIFKKSQTKTKKDSEPAFWRFWLPKHLMERNVSYRVFEKSGYQIPGFSSLTRFPSCQTLHEVKGNCGFPSLHSLKRKKYKLESKKTARYLKKWDATNLYFVVKDQTTTGSAQSDDPTSYQMGTVGVAFNVTAEQCITKLAHSVIQSLYYSLNTIG